MRGSWVVLALLAVISAGCGDRGDQEVVVTETPEFDSPSPGESVIVASRSGRSTATLSGGQGPKGSNASPSGPVSDAPPADSPVPFLIVVPQLSADGVEFEPRVQVELSGTIGGREERVVDLTTRDGLGLKGRFRSVRRGHYLMRITTPIVPDYPLVSRPVEVSGDRPESVAFGAVVFRIPKERAFEVAKAIEVALVEEPARKPVMKATLATVATTGVYGEVHPLTMPLPFGEYSYTLADVSKDPTIGFANFPKGAKTQLSENSFVLRPEKPVTLVNLESVLRVK